MKKNSIKEKKENFKMKKILKLKISSKDKNLNGKKLVVSVLSAAMVCDIHGATIKNILFEDNDSVNTFHTFNLAQTFLHLKKRIFIDPLVIILLCNSYF